MKQFKGIIFMSLLVAAVLCVGVDVAGAIDTAPGPAYMTIDGKISKIEGAVYTIQSESSNYQNLGTSKNVSVTKIYVGGETKMLGGDKKVGDKVRAEITRGGFANSVQ